MKTDVLVVGAGITGITLAEKFASDGRKVLIVEKRNHIGGNCYDYYDDYGILIHKYGPHIFHTKHKDVWQYLSQFTDWIYYNHRVVGFIDGKLMPIPFNLNSLHLAFSKSIADSLERKLIERFGYGRKVSILTLRETDDSELKILADYIYEKVFLNYTVKQWNITPDKIEQFVLDRIPVSITKDDRYFPDDRYQGMPKDGYTKMFEKMLDNPNIKILLQTDYKEVIEDVKFEIMFYTGPIDYFFDHKYGKLPYRHLKFVFKTLDGDFQANSVINYNNNYDFTRITEFKKLTGQKHEKTTICIEYPSDDGVPAYPIFNKETQEELEAYKEEVRKMEKNGIYFAGRLAEYKYYNMDEAVYSALNLWKRIR